MTGLQWLGLAMLASPFIAAYIWAWFSERESAIAITVVALLASFLYVGAMLLAGQ